jgi:GrpB-like predicted nucleotidyltransferase (UPF0157 family)
VTGGQSGSLTFRGSLKLWGQLLDRVALGIDHIASTSVPGLRAKDFIDVQVAVANLGTERIVPALAGLRFADDCFARSEVRDDIAHSASVSTALIRRVRYSWWTGISWASRNWVPTHAA